MISLKKRPMLSKLKAPIADSDSEEENGVSEESPLPVLSNNLKVPWRREKSKLNADDFYVLDAGNDEMPPAPTLSDVELVDKLRDRKSNNKLDTTLIDERTQKLLDKAVCGPSFEKSYGETANLLGRRALKRLRKLEREKTKGHDWFDLPATELTEEAKADLELLQMRAAIDPLAFYRRNDRKVLPKYFQVGRIVDAPEDFYSSRIPKKERKRTLLDELLNDQRLTQSKREKYNAIQAREKRKRRGAFQHSGFRRKERNADMKRRRK